MEIVAFSSRVTAASRVVAACMVTMNGITHFRVYVVGYYNIADNLVAIILHFGKEVLNINYFILPFCLLSCTIQLKSTYVWE